MKLHLKIILSIGTCALVFNGCAGKTPSNIADIEQKKQADLKNKIHISRANTLKAYANEESKLQYLCFQTDTNNCNYTRKEDQEVFWVNKKGYYPPISPSTKGVMCGTGSLAGWLAIFTIKPFGIENYTKKNAKICESRFTKLDSTLFVERFVFGLITFMTPFVSGGTLHTVKFDKDEFKEFVYITNIESFKENLLQITSKFNIDGGLDVIYLQSDNIADNLEEKYTQLLNDTSKKAGIIFLEEQSNRLLAIDIFDKYKNDNLIKSVSLQINDLFETIKQNSQYTLSYDDITPYIPPEIQLPKIPSVPKLIKDEFETKSDFQKRVTQAVAKREEQIRDLQRRYTLDVYERNTYIDNLQKSYKLYLQQTSEAKADFLQELKNSLALLSKVIFLENTSGYSAKDFKYNAETQKLFFQIYSMRNGFSQEVVATIPPDIAKKIKYSQTFQIIPNIEAHNNKLSLLGFEIKEKNSGEVFTTHYTNINYVPEELSVRIVGAKESIDKSISNYFKQYKQQNKAIIDNSKKEIWYIDIAKSINAKVPTWFSTPTSKNKVIGYGEGTTLTQAKANARDDLAFLVKVKVNTLFQTTSNINNFKSFNEIKQETKQSSDVELSLNDYKVFKQEKSDGRWYVGLEYIK